MFLIKKPAIQESHTVGDPSLKLYPTLFQYTGFVSHNSSSPPGFHQLCTLSNADVFDDTHWRITDIEFEVISHDKEQMTIRPITVYHGCNLAAILMGLYNSYCKFHPPEIIHVIYSDNARFTVTPEDTYASCVKKWELARDTSDRIYYRQYCQKHLSGKQKWRRIKHQATAQRIAAITSIAFKNAEAAKKFAAFAQNEANMYGQSLLDTAHIYATYMQYLLWLHPGTSIRHIAEEAFYASYSNFYTRWFWCTVVLLLEECWQHGDDLISWWDNDRNSP